jgi:LysM repeat protein
MKLFVAAILCTIQFCAFSQTYDTVYHTIDAGNTLFMISKEYGVSVDEIKALNPGRKTYMVVGTKLAVGLEERRNTTIKKSVAESSEAKEKLYERTPEENQKSEEVAKQYYNKPKSTPTIDTVGEPIYHTVEYGNLFDISDKYSVPVNYLKKWNNLTTSTLKMGQQLIVGYRNSNNSMIDQSQPVITQTNQQSLSQTQQNNIATNNQTLTPAKSQPTYDPAPNVNELVAKHETFSSMLNEINTLNISDNDRIKLKEEAIIAHEKKIITDAEAKASQQKEMELAALKAKQEEEAKIKAEEEKAAKEKELALAAEKAKQEEELKAKVKAEAEAKAKAEAEAKVVAEMKAKQEVKEAAEKLAAAQAKPAYDPLPNTQELVTKHNSLSSLYGEINLLNISDADKKKLKQEATIAYANKSQAENAQKEKEAALVAEQKKQEEEAKAKAEQEQKVAKDLKEKQEAMALQQKKSEADFKGALAAIIATQSKSEKDFKAASSTNIKETKTETVTSSTSTKPIVDIVPKTTINKAELTSKSAIDAKYRRSSLYTLMVHDPAREYADTIKEAFTNSPFPDKFNNHNLKEKVIQGRANDKDQLNTINNYLTSNQVAKELVAKWFNRSPKGIFNMNLIAERGQYNATEMDVNFAKQSARGTALLKDAGEELIGNTFIVVTDFKYLNKEDVANTAKKIVGLAKFIPGAGAAVNISATATNTALTVAGKGYFIKATSYLYRLKWNDSIAAVFYNDYWMDDKNYNESKKKAFENSSLFTLEYTGSEVASEQTQSSVFTSKTEEQLIARATTKSVDKVIAKLQRNHDQFKTKTPLYTTDPLAAKIGLKEGLEGGDRYEVLEQVEDEFGKTSYKRVSVITVDKKQIWDNRYMADEENPNNVYDRTLFIGNSKDLYPGMLIRQIR